VVRFVPKDFRQRRPDGNGGWLWTMKGIRRVLYRLDRLRGREAVVIVEGERDVDRLWADGIPATCNPGGAGKWLPEYPAMLKAAGAQRVVVIPDNDAPGRDHAVVVAKACHEAGLHTRGLDLPDVPVKGDVSDYLSSHSKDDLLKLLKAAPAFEPK